MNIAAGRESPSVSLSENNHAGVYATKSVSFSTVSGSRVDEKSAAEDARDDADAASIPSAVVAAARLLAKEKSAAEKTVAEKDAAAQARLMAKIKADIERYERSASPGGDSAGDGSSTGTATVVTQNTRESSVKELDDESRSYVSYARSEKAEDDDEYDGFENPFTSAVDWYKALLVELAKVEEKTAHSEGTESTHSTQKTATTKMSDITDWTKATQSTATTKMSLWGGVEKASSKVSWSNFFETKPSTRSDDKKADEEASDVYYPPVGVNKDKSKKTEPSEPSAVTKFLEEASLSIDSALINYDNKAPTPDDNDQVSLASKITNFISGNKNKPTDWMTPEEIEENRRLAEERGKQADINAYLKRNLIPKGFELGLVVPKDDTHSKLNEESKLADEIMEAYMPETADSKGQIVANVVEHGMSDKIHLGTLSDIPRCVNPDDIVIMVKCSSVSLRDCMLRRGASVELANSDLPLPYVPGSDMIGIVCALGDEAREAGIMKTGDRVAAFSARGGGNAKYATVSYRDCMAVPEAVGSMKALCLLSAYVPAFQALAAARKESKPFIDADILVVGVNPGNPVGLAIAELALMEGANVYVTADAAHHEFLGAKGVQCLDIDPSTWLNDLYGKMDVVVDSVCLDGRYNSSTMLLKETGTLVCTGMTAPYTKQAIEAGSWSAALRDKYARAVKSATQHFSSKAIWLDTIENHQYRKMEFGRHFQYLCHQSMAGTIKPAVASRGSLKKIAATHRLIEGGKSKFGVHLCTPWNSKHDGE